MQKKQSKYLLPHFCFNHFKCSHLVHQLLKQPVGPRPARRYPDLRLTQVRGHHNSTERLSRVRSDLHTSDHVLHDAEKKTNVQFLWLLSPIGDEATYVI